MSPPESTTRPRRLFRRWLPAAAAGLTIAAALLLVGLLSSDNRLDFGGHRWTPDGFPHGWAMTYTRGVPGVRLLESRYIYGESWQAAFRQSYVPATSKRVARFRRGKLLSRRVEVYDSSSEQWVNQGAAAVYWPDGTTSLGEYAGTKRCGTWITRDRHGREIAADGAYDPLDFGGHQWTPTGAPRHGLMVYTCNDPNLQLLEFRDPFCSIPSSLPQEQQVAQFRRSKLARRLIQHYHPASKRWVNEQPPD